MSGVGYIKWNDKPSVKEWRRREENVENDIAFREFPKITRFYEQDIVVTEKIDGTNGLIFVPDDGGPLKAGSRTRWITPKDDNYGFARWVEDNQDALRELGPGFHYGEWWGQGIQRKYGMPKKVFSLFNVHRWVDETIRPACCDIVPVLYTGPVAPGVIEQFSGRLDRSEAAARYGVEFNNPEGCMIYFTKGSVYFKAPIEREHKRHTVSQP